MIRLSPSSAFSYAIDPDARLVVARMVGTLTGPDMKVIADTVHEDSKWDPTFDVIWNCSDVRAHVIQPDDVSPLVEAMADEDVDPEDRTGRDILIESRSLAESMFTQMLVHRLRRSGDDAHAVQTMAEALDVLDLKELPEALDLEDAADADGQIR